MDISLYIHYPFCVKKCNYCDFVSVCKCYDEQIINSAFIKSLNKFSNVLENKNIKTLFFGGGTPSLATLSFFESIIKNINSSKLEEISVEINPASINEDKLKDLKNLGINRVSIGVQALNDSDLELLGRIHNSKQALQCIESVAKHFKNYSIDLIYGRPNQSVESWGKELESAMKISAPHMSLYQLTIENGWDVELPNSDTISYMIDATQYIVAGKYKHYEISNYATKGCECLHNLAYWKVNDFLGIGPAAHSRVNGKAISQNENVDEWLTNQNYTEESLSESDVAKEKIIMGLRTCYGIDLNENIMKYFNHIKLDEAVKSKYLVIKGDNIAPTDSGMKVLDYLLEQIID